MKVKVAQSCPILCGPHGLYSPWNSPGQNTGVGSLSLLHGIFPTQRLNPGLLRCRQILSQLSHKGSPILVNAWTQFWSPSRIRWLSSLPFPLYWSFSATLTYTLINQMIETGALWEKVRVGCFERTALKQVYYQGWNRLPAQVGCMRQVLGAGALERPWGMGWRGRREGGSGWGIHDMADSCQCMAKPLQYCKVISLQLVKINGKKKERNCIKTADPAKLNYQWNLTQVLTPPFWIHIFFSFIPEHHTLLPHSLTTYSVFFACSSSSHWLLIFSVLPGLVLNFFLVFIHSHDNLTPWIWISSILNDLSFLFNSEYCCLVVKSCLTLLQPQGL